MKVRLDHHPNYWGKNVPNHQPINISIYSSRDVQGYNKLAGGFDHLEKY